MRHRKAGVKLNRTSSHRKAMFRNMVTSLLKHEKIQTTDTKAKALRAWVDHIITLAKRGDLHARRQAMAIVREKSVVHKLFSEATEKFGTRDGGYTRIIKLGKRPGDAAPVSIMELITSADLPKKKVVRKKEMPVAPKVIERDSGTESGMPQEDKGVVSAQEKPSEETKVFPTDSGTDDSGVEVATPVKEENVDQEISEMKASEETGESQAAQDEALLDDQNREEKK